MVKYSKTPYELLLDFQTRLQGVGNSLAADIGAIISKTDKALLNTVINSMPSGQSSVKAQMRALEKMVRQIEQIRAEGFTLAERHFMDAGPEIAKRAGNTISRFAEAGGAKLARALSPKKIDEILNYHPVDGKSISQWFHAMRTSDLERITQTVQRASVEGMSISKVVSAIRGTKENGYRDGILETTRQSASTTARTIVNGVASNSMLETCAENADAIDGIKFVATLDAKTCPFCGSFDGKDLETRRGRARQTPSSAPELPLHRHSAHRNRGRNRRETPCRQRRFRQDWRRKRTTARRAKRGLNGATKISLPRPGSNTTTRPRNSMRRIPGKPAFSQVKGDVSFRDYFEGQPESFKRSWLGPKRYELYSKEGKYNPMSLGNPDTGYRRAGGGFEVKTGV
jgi:hypothetical protein